MRNSAVYSASLRSIGRRFSAIFRAESFESSSTALFSVIRKSLGLLTKREKFQLFFRLFARLSLNLLDIVALGLMGFLGAITATGLSGQNIELFGFSVPPPNAENVILLVALVAGLFLVKGGLGILFLRWTAIFLAELEIRASVKISRYLFSGPLTRLRHFTRAELQFLVESATSATFSGVLGSVSTLFIETTLFFSIFVVFLLVDWVSAVLILVFFAGLVYLLQMSTARRFLQSGINVRRGAVESGGVVLEMVDGFREISVLSKQDFFLSRYLEAKKLSARTGVTLKILNSLPRYIAESSLILGALLFGIWQLQKGTLGEGLITLGVFLAGSYRMMGAILPLQTVWNELRIMQDWVVHSQELLAMLRDTPENLDTRIYSDTKTRGVVGSQPPARKGIGLVISNLGFTHAGKSEPTIKNVSMEIRPGEYVAIVGPSGAGKTTLVDLMLGLYTPDVGSVTLDCLDPSSLRRVSPGQVSYVPQRPGLVSGTISQNVALGVPDDEIDEKRVWHVLGKAQLRALVESLPDGIHSSLGAHSDSLSGGQIQRLGFARALYTKPRLVILDEATSALDAATEASVAASVKNVGKGTTVVVIAHRLSTIQDAETVFVMEDGRIISRGTFSEVRKAVPMVEEYVKLMSFDDD